jgi:hypothetical protein
VTVSERRSIGVIDRDVTKNGRGPRAAFAAASRVR